MISDAELLKLVMERYPEQPTPFIIEQFTVLKAGLIQANNKLAAMDMEEPVCEQVIIEEPMPEAAVRRTPEISEGGASGSDAPFRGVCLGGEAGKRGGPSAVGSGIALVRAAPLRDARLVCVPFVAPDFNKRFF